MIERSKKRKQNVVFIELNIILIISLINKSYVVTPFNFFL